MATATFSLASVTASVTHCEHLAWFRVHHTVKTCMGYVYVYMWGAINTESLMMQFAACLPAVCVVTQDVLLCTQTRLLEICCSRVTTPLRGFEAKKRYWHFRIWRCCWSVFRYKNTLLMLFELSSVETNMKKTTHTHLLIISVFQTTLQIVLFTCWDLILPFKSTNTNTIIFFYWCFFSIYFPVLTSIGWFAYVHGTFTVVCVVVMTDATNELASLKPMKLKMVGSNRLHLQNGLATHF